MANQKTAALHSDKYRVNMITSTAVIEHMWRKKNGHLPEPPSLIERLKDCLGLRRKA